MARYAVVNIETLEVVNIIEYDGKAEYDPGEGNKLVKCKAADEVQIGFEHDGKKFIDTTEQE